MDKHLTIQLSTEQWKQNATAFFGPEDYCEMESRIAAAWNTPILAYVSTLSLSLCVCICVCVCVYEMENRIAAAWNTPILAYMSTLSLSLCICVYVCDREPDSCSLEYSYTGLCEYTIYIYIYIYIYLCVSE